MLYAVDLSFLWGGAREMDLEVAAVHGSCSVLPTCLLCSCPLSSVRPHDVLCMWSPVDDVRHLVTCLAGLGTFSLDTWLF